MNPKLNEAAALYLKEMAVLEDARDTLLSTLTAMWSEIDESCRQDLEALAVSANGKMAKWDNKSNPAHHERWIEKKDSIVFKVMIDDPRLTRAGYKITINCTNEERGKLNRISGAHDRFEELARASKIQQIRWTRSDIWSTEMAIDTTDLVQSANDVANRVSSIFTVLSSFSVFMSELEVPTHTP